MAERPKWIKDPPMEMRLLLAFILMGVVLFFTPYFYKPQPPPEKPKAAPATQTPKKESPAEAVKSAPAPPAKETAPPKDKERATQPPRAAAQEGTHKIETSLYRIEFSNRGAVLRSWVLKKYHDSAGKPLELVNQAATGKTSYPLSLAFKNQKPDVDLDQALFLARPQPGGLGIDFEFSDGSVICRKSFRVLQETYLSEISSEVTLRGTEVPHLLVWRGGFGDYKVPNAADAQHTVHYDQAQNKLVTKEAKDAKDGPVSESGAYAFAGLEDAFFAAVFLPRGNANYEIQTVSNSFPSQPNAKDELHIGAGVGGDGKNHFALFVGPKDMDILRKIDPKLDQVVDFGWFGLLAKPLFLSLNWVNDNWVRNYGWSIVLVTVVINCLLLPLKFTSMKSMKKMQVLQPQMAAINAKYKNIGIRDPRKAEQNQEVMELYKKHGVNPAGGCLPMILQIPFFIAFYKVLTVAIEMRGAKWLWVTDLSQPETLAIRILPLAMLATQFVLQKMTPATSPDPQQQRIMLLMPLMLGFMFYGVSSGLVLYWLTGNLVGIAQQFLFNHLGKAPVAVSKPAPSVAKKKNSKH